MTNDLHHAISNVATWIQPEYVSKNLVGSPDRCVRCCCFQQRERWEKVFVPLEISYIQAFNVRQTVFKTVLKLITTVT